MGKLGYSGLNATFASEKVSKMALLPRDCHPMNHVGTSVAITQAIAVKSTICRLPAAITR